MGSVTSPSNTTQLSRSFVMSDHSINQKEVWKDVVGYESLYRVSNLGRVKSLNRITKRKDGILCPYYGKVLKFGTMSKGYKTVGLCKSGRVKTHLVHCLVLEAFVGARPIGHEVRHFPDKNKSNNKLTNIQWGTHRQNQLDRTFHGTDNTTLAKIRRDKRKKEAMTV